MALEPNRLPVSGIALEQVSADDRRRAQIAVASYARREHPTPRANAKPETHARANQKAKNLCAELLDILGLLPKDTEHG